MTKLLPSLAVMIADTNRISGRTLQRQLAGKPNVTHVEVFDHLEVARQAVSGGGFNCLFVDIFSLGIDAGIELIQYLQARSPAAPICLYSDSSNLITMPDVSEYWRKKFGHYPKLGKDQLAQGGGTELDTLLGQLAIHLHKMSSRKKTSGLLPSALRPPAAKTGGLRRAIAKQVAESQGTAKSDKAVQPPAASAAYLPSQPMLSPEEYGVEIATPLPGAKTGPAFEITGTYKYLPAGQHLWVATVVEREIQNPTTGDKLVVKQVWPQTEATTQAGTQWHARLDDAGGGPSEFKTLLVCVVGHNGQVLFEYFRRAGRETRELFQKMKASGFVTGNFESWPPLLTFTDDVVEGATVPIAI